MEEKRKKALYLQLINKRRKLANLRETIMCSKEGIQNAGIKLNNGIEFSSSLTIHDVNMNTSEDSEGKVLDYDSDDSVKDKNYDPSKDFSDDDSYISNSPDHDITQSRKNLVKRKLFTPDNSPQKQDIDHDLITLGDLINAGEKCQEPGTSYDISEFDNQIEMAEQTVAMDFSEDTINNTCQKHPNDVINDTPTMMNNEPITTATNDIRVESSCENIRRPTTKIDDDICGSIDSAPIRSPPSSTL